MLDWDLAQSSFSNGKLFSSDRVIYHCDWPLGFRYSKMGSGALITVNSTLMSQAVFIPPSEHFDAVCVKVISTFLFKLTLTFLLLNVSKNYVLMISYNGLSTLRLHLAHLISSLYLAIPTCQMLVGILIRLKSFSLLAVLLRA
jgi:hypothetical protein